MAATEILLTEEQRLEFTQIPQNISEWEIAKYYTFTDNDMEIINRHRRDYNRLGYQHKQFLSSYWGDGSTSSSDGMRVQVGVSSLHAEHNTHYGSEKGTTMYAL